MTTQPVATASKPHQKSREYARQLDEEDPLRQFRDQFHLPRRPDGTPYVYFCGHSLGLQPKGVRAAVEQELDQWASLGVQGHFKGEHPWYTYQDRFLKSTAKLVGAKRDEVVLMNTSTVNLHLMLATFYRPNKNRYKIMIDEPAFPSDLYAVQTHIRHHGLDPAEALVHVRPQRGEHTIETKYLNNFIATHERSLALVLLSGVNFATGQWFDINQASQACRSQGCLLGLSLPHAVGNVPLELHQWDVDFAVWCNYKYVNAGPGAIGGCFVHEKHGSRPDLPRLAGWWGNDPSTRFDMDKQRQFVPQAGAAGWQISNPPILALAPLKATLARFDDAGMGALRSKSKQMMSFMQFLLERMGRVRIEQITPREGTRRGCAMSLLIPEKGREVVKSLESRGILVDFRPPNILRAAAVPLYNTFEDVWVFVQALSDILGGK